MTKVMFVALLCMLAVWGCSQETAVPPATSPAVAASETPKPAPTVDPYPSPRMKISGEEQVVFDWSKDQCQPGNIPDLAARAFRDDSGQAHLLLSHDVNYQLVGEDLNHVTPDCSPIMASDLDADPSQFNDGEWIASPYTEDGQTIYALVHNEYRGHMHPGMCPSGDYFDCLDTTITLAVSRNAGASFTDAAPAPAHLVASLPYEWEAGMGPFGLRTPSNIIKGQDGRYYVFANVSQYNTHRQWVCLMRTSDLADPGAWEYWDGGAFTGRFIDPYQEKPANALENLCGELANYEIGASLNESITYNTYLERYVLVGNSADSIEGREVWGWYYAFSHDLIHWTHRELLAEVPLPWTVGNSGADESVLYPALLDPASDSRNFETTGRTAYLYFTRMNHGAGSLDRDLVRVPVEFVRSP